jgi:predicted peptidase
MHRRYVGLVVGLLIAAGALYGAAKGTWQYGQWSEMQSFTSSAGDTINYYLFTPQAAGGGKKLPLVVWLHGGVKSNGVGGPNFAQDAFYRDEHQKDHPAFCLRPVAVKGENWVSPRGAGTSTHQMPAAPAKSMKAALELIEKVLKENPIDPARLYVVGASMGGYGTWDMIERNPGKFAAAMPICGGGDPSKAALLKDMAIWISHGDKDSIVSVRGSRDMFDALLKARGEPPVVKDAPDRITRTSPDGRIRYIEYKGGNHNAAWDRGLTEPDLAEWFFSKSLPAK